MDEDMLADLKQFIATTVSQQIAGLRSEFTDKLHEETSAIRTQIDDLRTDLSQQISNLSESVADAIDTNNDVVADQLKDHEHRITRLKQQAA